MLRKSEMHYRIVSELTTTFVFDLLVAKDGEVSLDFVSDNFYSFSGRAKHEVRTLELLLGHIHPEDRGKLDDLLRSLIVKPQSLEIECRAFIRNPHELRWLALYGQSEWDEEQGRVTAVYGAAKDITERKLAEQALRESNTRFQRLADSIQGFIAYVNADTLTYEFVNETYARSFGVPREKIIGRHIRDIIGEPNYLFALKYIEEVRSGRSSSYENSFNFVSGTRWVLVTYSPVVGANGKVESIAVLNYDITEQKQADEARAQEVRDQRRAEESLRASEQIIEGLLNAIPAGVIWKDKNLVYLGSNAEFARDAGLDSPRDVIGKDDFQMSWREQAESYRRDDLEVMESGRAKLGIEEPHTSSDGVTRTFLTNKVPLRNAKGEISGVLGTFMDISRRRHAEEALQKNEERLQRSESMYRRLIETAPEAIYVIADEKVVFCNNHALEMLGYSREEMLGMAMEKINHPQDWARARERYKSRAEGKSLTKSASRHVTKQGTPIWVECVGERIEWEGRPAVLYFSSDITERKNEADEKVRVQQYLQQTQRLESLGILAGGIAHDFNNILMGIFGFADLARDEKKPENVSAYLAKVMESMTRAKALTQQLLTFSKGGTPIRRVEQIAPLLKETCQFALHGSNLMSNYEIQDDLWSSNIDRNQVGQVIQNIVINAIQAMPMGGTIMVAARNISLRRGEHPTLEAGDYVVISVKDQGIGISEEMLSRIFDPFFTTKIKGHGLGLAISHSIIGRHGGAINVQSELGRGTTFSVFLPACGGCRPEDAERAEIRHVGEGTILVMDDDIAIRKLLSLMLESLGYSVICQDCGAATIDCFKEEERNGRLLSAVILDLTIPGGMGGKEVAAEVRKLNPAIPIFVSSGYAEDPIMANPTKYGITASLSKPFRKVELMEMLEKHMSRSKDPA